MDPNWFIISIRQSNLFVATDSDCQIYLRLIWFGLEGLSPTDYLQSKHTLLKKARTFWSSLSGSIRRKIYTVLHVGQLHISSFIFITGYSASDLFPHNTFKICSESCQWSYNSLKAVNYPISCSWVDFSNQGWTLKKTNQWKRRELWRGFQKVVSFMKRYSIFHRGKQKSQIIHAKSMRFYRPIHHVGLYHYQ